MAVAGVTAPAPAPAPDALAGAVDAEADRPFTSAEPTITTALSTTTRVAFEPAPLRKAVQPRGKWVVQLGAYRDQQRVEAGWITLRSEEHTYELQATMRISNASLCLQNKTQ